MGQSRDEYEKHKKEGQISDIKSKRKKKKKQQADTFVSLPSLFLILVFFVCGGRYLLVIERKKREKRY